MGTLYTYTAFVGKFNVLQIDVVTGPSLIYIAYIIDRYFIYIYIHVGKFLIHTGSSIQYTSCVELYIIYICTPLQV